ncbi:AAA family ATPase [Mesoplasma lactucae]|uniref:ATPase AAA-type core domain-containing protein n=1 Tax=Mesoplasma lactucae ATCC 49193 TaxID=81460 RepID=A0A291IR00_9MOLU|nr:AAA family ATPase [Mesoplasma lactucae]ATG97158.1 hypothetical protein CP520_00050 [Mesoplasma lactucae ATCC 49193]ATZ20402.1 hypothetical protein MLACT_v1c05810 [Mesoplasma lactucae ATCC 49193]MCL8216573.1 hypothetical protein [Mesoplasma lactucae ATCC 49193]
MSQRKIKISKYRNLGIKKDDEVILNQALSKGKIGDLVTLIGPNNLGKSNVLAAIKNISNYNRITDYDINERAMSKDEKDVSLDLVVNTDSGFTFHYKKTKNEWFGTPWKCNNETQERIDYGFEEFKDICEKVIEKAKENEIPALNNNGHYSNGRYIYNNTEQVELAEAQFEMNTQWFKNRNFILDNAKNDIQSLSILSTWLKNYLVEEGESRNNEFVKRILSKKYNKLSKVLTSPFDDELGFNLIPNIYEYKDNLEIKDSDLSVEVHDGQMKLNPFLERIFKAINQDPSEFTDSYNNYKTNKRLSLIRDMEAPLNKRLQEISKKFNNIYNVGKERYKFKLLINPSDVTFAMTDKKQAVSISRTSEGFKWFFNFFFNYLLEKPFKPGDIVLIDEIGSRLHPKGIIELREFLKDYSIENDLTFVTATHSCQMVNNDCLEELRIVQESDEGSNSTIKNRFTMNDSKEGDYDILYDLKAALTVEQHQIMDPNVEVVFVEGETDYSYLSAMKNFFGLGKILFFIPIQGVLMNKEKFEELIQKLRKIRKNPRFLIDGDNAGMKFKKIAEDNDYEAITLTDINPSFKVIEDLFSKEDLEKFGLKNKTYNNASVFKKTVKKEDLSKETLNNFEKLFMEIK